jgi:hypothetical protein
MMTKWMPFKPDCPVRKRRKRIAVNDAKLKKLAETAAANGVPITIEHVAPDGTRTIVTAGGDVTSSSTATVNPWDSVLDADQKRAS